MNWGPGPGVGVERRWEGWGPQRNDLVGMYWLGVGVEGSCLCCVTSGLKDPSCPAHSTISPRKPQWVIHAESLPLGRGADGKRPQSPSLDLALPSPCAGIGSGDWLPLGLGAACSGPAVVWCGPAHDGG